MALTVNGDEPPGVMGVSRDRIGDPGPEAALEGLGLEGHEQVPDSVARRDTVGQGEMPGQPGSPMLGPAMNGGGPIAPADDAADRDDVDVHHQMLAIARVAGIGE